MDIVLTTRLSNNYQVAANGDTANKIGTYQLAVLAKHHNIPFFVAAPLSSLDLDLPRGADICIEERPGDEVALLQGLRIVAEGVRVWNPRLWSYLKAV